MKPTSQNFLTEVSSRVEAEGYASGDILQRASSIVVFGSRASGVNSPSSDLDVLCVGIGDRIKSPSLYLLWINEQTILDGWLGSELATHVAEYGIPVKGDFGWASGAFFGPGALVNKRRRILGIIKHVSYGWQRLHPAFRRKYQTTLRRELQRYSLLAQRVPIPPTPVLDLGWKSTQTLSSILATDWLTASGALVETLLLADTDDIRRADLFSDVG